MSPRPWGVNRNAAGTARFGDLRPDIRRGDVAVARLALVTDPSTPDLASEDTPDGAGRTAAGTGKGRFPLARWVLAPAHDVAGAAPGRRLW